MSASKNARRGKTTDTHNCSCGGELKVFSVHNGRRLRNVMRCKECGKEGRKVADFKGAKIIELGKRSETDN
jgi:predicted RNA-binding Zn-ribbon protein involved in translation (DUF1610 family)